MEGLKKILSAQTAGLPNWAWLLIIGGGIAAAIIVPKFFKGFGGTSTDTTSTYTGTTATPSTDMSGYTPYSGGYGGGGGTTDGGGIPPTTDGTNAPTPVPPVVGGTTPPPVFPPVQPSAPAPPPSTAPADQCKQRQGCIDYHVRHTCDKLKGDKKTECINHWTTKCANTHPCGHSLVPSVKEDTHTWPHNRQQRRDTSAMDMSIEEGMIDE